MSGEAITPPCDDLPQQEEGEALTMSRVPREPLGMGSKVSLLANSMGGEYRVAVSHGSDLRA